MNGLQRTGGGPYFDDLRHGDMLGPGPRSPVATLTEGLAAAHRVIVGHRLTPPHPDLLSTEVPGAPIVHPALVWDIAIAQSLAMTPPDSANLVHRNLVFRRMPSIGDTLATHTQVIGLRQSSSEPTGLVALRMTTVDQRDRPVLDSWRYARLPLSTDGVQTGSNDDLARLVGPPSSADKSAAVAGWDLSRISTGTDLPRAGDTWQLEPGDLVSSAEMARSTLPVAEVHHDAEIDDSRRLVHGGHTISLALEQAAEAIPGLVTVTTWESCDHTGPVHEGDTVTSTVFVEDIRARDGGGWFLDLRSVVRAVSPLGDEPRSVLYWRFTALAV